MSYAVGSLVRARGREWVVLPDSSDELVMVRPLGGTEDEVTGIVTTLEPVEPASFDLPDPAEIGDHRSAKLLRDAVRLGFRSSAGPFRSFAGIGVEPRPYQFVPLLMALKLDPVRLLIADDVGIGKTIEAGLLARELLDRAEISRMAVLCPPHLAEQWQSELREKFHIDAQLVLPGTVTRLERNLGLGESIFDVYPFTIVSLDFIKSDRRRHDFLRTCPEMVIVDEAHTCAWADRPGSGRHQRHELVKQVANRDPDRHLILVTATPHSGDEDAFRSLLTLLDPTFAELPEDLSGSENEHHRRRLAAHFVQRRRADIRQYMDENTPFPDRLEREESYKLHPEYRKLFDRVLAYARETVTDTEGGRHRQRVRWWSALALLRSLGSSPAAAASTLRSRAAPADTDNLDEADEVGRRAVLDLEDEGSSESLDATPGADPGEMIGDAERDRRRLREMARQAEALFGDKDEKLTEATRLVKSLLKDGAKPIIFCRFIATAEYVAEELRRRLPKDVEVAAVTGTLPPAEREARVLQMEGSDKRVLVATNCLSEGINLQNLFDAVVHYDLSWNPTRHEQREGRVDRYGQPSDNVRVVTLYGLDNQIDGIVLDVLLRKHKRIRTSLGISVPVPASTDQVVEAIFEGLLLRETSGGIEQYLPGFEEYFRPRKEQFHAEWDNATERERRSQTMFAQQSIRVDEVERELHAVRSAIGSSVDVAEFMENAVRAARGTVSWNGHYTFDLTESPVGLRDLIDRDQQVLRAAFELPVPEHVEYLSRTHPVVESVATWTMNTALDPEEDGIAARCGAIRTRAVEAMTTLLLVRFRYHIITRQGSEERTLLAEDCRLLGFSGQPSNADWISSDEAETLLDSQPDANVNPAQAEGFVQRVIDGYPEIRLRLEQIAEERGDELLDAHRRVRQASRQRGINQRVEPNLPPDILGIYVYLPVVN